MQTGTSSLLAHLRRNALDVPFRANDPRLMMIGDMTSIFGPARLGPGRNGLPPHRIHYVAIQAAWASLPLLRFVEDVRRCELEHAAGGTPHWVPDRVVPVPSVGALSAARSKAHVEGGLTGLTRLRENGASLCLAALREAEIRAAAARRARKPESRAAMAEHARIALEAARLVAEDFELGETVVVPTYATLAPDLWSLVAPAYLRESAMLDRPAPLPDDDAAALEALVIDFA